MGVPYAYQQTYEDFLAEPRPMELVRELAYLRTVITELRDSFERRRPDRYGEFSVSVNLEFGDFLERSGVSPETTREIVKELDQIMFQRFFEFIGKVDWMDANEAKTLADLVDKSSRIAERMKKIQEGTLLKVEFSGPELMNFLKWVVLPLLPEIERRKQLAAKAKSYLASVQGNTSALADPDIIDVLPEEEPSAVPFA